jgi:type II secretory pathway pseudopilin PulG
MTRGQVWIETVLYTLIGLALIGVVLAIASPQINETKDRIIVDQTVDSLNLFDQKVYAAIDGSPGNIRKVNAFRMKRGSLLINKTGEEIYYVLDGLGRPYSQPGEVIEDGRVSVLTIERTNSYTVRLTLSYQGIADIGYDGDELVKTYNAAATAYTFDIINRGDTNDDGLKEIWVEEVSGR